VKAIIKFLRERFPTGLFPAILVVAVVGTGIVGGVVAAYMRDLPSLDVLEEYQPSLITTLYDDQGKPFATFYEQRRILAPLAEIPQLLRDALIAVGPGATAELIDLIAGAGPAAKIEAVRALAGIQDQRSIPALYALLEDPSTLVQHWAEEALERMGVGMVYFKP